jgi:2-polyprenyl-3-methyl-5-hydroxy-6-metoxy-1,4-benzoquinol methylase
MNKYSNSLDMSTDNSAAIILRNILPNTKVLEFGAGNGYMTKYLKESLNCEIDIVEIDCDNGLEASKYASYYLIGESMGDIEEFYWLRALKDKKYDHIIFADVLEHLYDPYKVLESASKLLNDNGTILISIPNVSHNSVIIDLINNNFEYRDLGLLDNTHIRFFARKSLTKMVTNAGLKISKEMNSHCAVEDTEFKNHFGHVSPFAEEILRRRDDGDIYQFIWELKL